MFKLLICVATLSLAQICNAQTPDWIDYEKRMSKYPSESYLTGYTTEVDVKFGETIKQSLISTAKVNLMESIQVSIASISTLQIATEDGETNTAYLNTTKSKSTVNIVGMKSETYYDKKSKTAYGFVYALKANVIKHYRDLVKVTTTETQNSNNACQSFLSANDINNALDNMLKAKDQLIVLRQAQANLLALGVKDQLSLNIIGINKLDQDNRELSSRLLSSPYFSTANLSQYLTYKMRQILSVDETIHVMKIRFEDYELDSPFGSSLSKYLAEDLIKSSYKISSTKAESTFYIATLFSDDNQNVNVSLEVIDKKTKEILTTVNGHMTTQYFADNKLSYLPKPVAQFRTLANAKMSPLPKSINAQFNKPLAQPIQLKITDQKGNPLKGIPCNYNHKTSPQINGVVLSDDQGIATLPLEKIGSPKKMQFIAMSMNGEKYLGLTNDDPLFQKLISQYKLPQSNFRIKVSGTSLYIDATETLLGAPYQQHLVSNKIKQSLTELGFVIVNDIDNANYMMDITVGSSMGGQYQSLYFSFANVTINLSDMENGDEIFSQTFLKIKEGGSNHKAAAIKAYNKAAEKVAKEIKTTFQ